MERQAHYAGALGGSPHGIDNAARDTNGPSRWGYGRMWVWDQSKLPAGISVGEFTGAYAAWGTGGHSITVLPVLDMVVAHKVELEGHSPGDKW